MHKPKAIFCWSGGKDSSLALREVLQEGRYEICYLLTSLNATFKRISMHGIREELLDLQAESIGIPLLKIWVSEGTNEEYERLMEQALREVKAEGISTVIYGDIFLEDLRRYREVNLEKVGMQAYFPLWKRDTATLIREFVEAGFKTIITCTFDAHLDSRWCGRVIDRRLIEELPKNVDPCGENGEYHTFCFDGPIFAKPIRFEVGEKTFRPLELKRNDQDEQVSNGFWFCDLR